jgi:Family of unknown function (DUF6627)
MKMKNPIRRHLVPILAAGAIGASLAAAPAGAGMISTDRVAAPPSAAQQRERIKALVARPDVARQLQALGVPPGQVEGRVNAMTDEEVVALAHRIDALPAGGMSDTNWLLVIIAVLLLVIAL